MPWLTIIMALVSFFLQKKSGASNTKAALTAGLVGAGTYYVTHETDWGKANLGRFDGVTIDGDEVIKDSSGNVITDTEGNPIKTGSNTAGTSLMDVIKSWGATGTAAVIGTTAAATGTGLFKKENLPWLIGGAAVLFILMR